MEDTFATTYDDETFATENFFGGAPDQDEDTTFDEESFVNAHATKKKRTRAGIIAKFNEAAKQVSELIRECKSHEGFANPDAEQMVDDACQKMAASVVEAFDTFVGSSGEGFVTTRKYRPGPGGRRVDRRPSNFGEEALRNMRSAGVIGYKKVTEDQHIDAYKKARDLQFAKTEARREKFSKPGLILPKHITEKRASQKQKRIEKKLAAQGVKVSEGFYY